MKRFTIVLLVLYLIIPALADDATQTDWSGGAGVDGPVTDWDDEFDSSADVSWLPIQGQLSLSSSPITSVRHAVDDNVDGVRNVYAADVDGDGDLDILGAAIFDDDITWWENDGSGDVWIEHIIDDYYRGTRSVCAVDMDSDGDLDILGVAGDSNYIDWWENDGSGGGWIKHFVDNSCYSPASAYAFDIDGDSDMDVVVAASYGDEIILCENDGSGGWIRHLIEGGFVGACEAYASDIDGDGDLDILGAAWFLNDIMWWENDGSGCDGDWTKHTVDDHFYSAVSVYAADVDGDGDLDILAAALREDIIAWWEVTEFESSGELTSSIFDTGGSAVGWGTWDYSGTLPDDTALTVEARASNDSGSMGSWVELSPGDLSDHLTDGERYLQYRLSLSTTDSDYSPIVRSIYFTWSNDSAIESVDLYANSKDEGILLSWSIVGDEPASVSVLRGLTQNGSVSQNDTVALSGELSGSATSWLDVSVEEGMEYAYYLEVTELDGTVSRFGPSEVIVPGAVSELALSDPYPNPADESLTIHYELTQNATVKLHIYDVAGRLV